ncbi:imidazole glycerol phosphate synthase-like protein hisHF [Myxozyma melibiosi]|uniref:Imidazole glycerol phosphate synthase hisHF n=1 Tax=Myxozyma melibiosi TaxID=54550 RepID=A0ABR1F589_9ASCO
MTANTVYVLDLESGNLRSLQNALAKLGYDVKWIKTPEDGLDEAQILLFPGVGNFGHTVANLRRRGFVEPLKAYIASGRRIMGICVGLQALFTGSTESPGVEGLGIIPAQLEKFDDSNKSVPHIGWNSAAVIDEDKQGLYGLRPDSKYYYVHSYRASVAAVVAAGWTVATGNYNGEEFVGAVCKDNVFATQFHPEKSGVAGLKVLRAFLEGEVISKSAVEAAVGAVVKPGLTKRVIACLDVRTNDDGDLVVTKGDQYDVREKSATASTGGQVRNLGKPVEMAERYYLEGADEVTFLNITSFRNCPLVDTPMLEILRKTSETVFVPLTIGGGIRDIVDPDGTKISALDVASTYFRSGADKVSIGSDAVFAAEEFYANGEKLTGKTAMETISRAYGAQAVVISVDPKRVYVDSPDATTHHVIKTATPGPNGEVYAWYQCTVKGGRETRDMDVIQLVTAMEKMGAGEILLNCINKDGTNSGFDLELIQDVKDAVSIPVIASSGAGKPDHFLEVFEKTTTDAALGAGMFHRGEYKVSDVKQYLSEHGLLVRNELEFSL